METVKKKDEKVLSPWFGKYPHLFLLKNHFAEIDRVFFTERVSTPIFYFLIELLYIWSI